MPHSPYPSSSPGSLGEENSWRGGRPPGWEKGRWGGAGAWREGQGRGLRKVWPLVFSWLPGSSPSAPAGASHVWFIREKNGKGLSSMLGPSPGRGKGTAADVVLRRVGTQRWREKSGAQQRQPLREARGCVPGRSGSFLGRKIPETVETHPPPHPSLTCPVDAPAGEALSKLKLLPFSKGLLPFLYPGQHVVYPSPQPSPKVVAVLSQLSRELREPQIPTGFQPTPQHC